MGGTSHGVLGGAGLALAAASGAAIALALTHWRRRRQPPWLTGTFVPVQPAALPRCPFALLSEWMADAQRELGFLEAHAMVIATSSVDGGATARTVVLQTADAKRGLMFGSNRSSLKGRQTAESPKCEAVLRFGQRQVRVRGELRFDESATVESFNLVAPSARLGLAALKQGTAVVDESGYQEIAARLTAEAPHAAEKRLAPPSSYVAFVLRPVSFEFYNGGHACYCNDRFLYVRSAGGDAFESPVRLQA